MILRKPKHALLGLSYVLLYLPMLLVMFYSFNDAEFSTVWRGFTTHWYQELWKHQDLWLATKNSLYVGMLSATCATTLGLFAALSMERYFQKGKTLMESVLFVLVTAPDILTAISLLLFFTLWHYPLGLGTVLIAHITLSLPFATLTIRTRLIDLDPNLSEAARDLGATEAMTLRRLILPMLTPSILAAWLLAFMLSFDEVVVSYFVNGAETPLLPLWIYAMLRVGIKPEINALCTVLFAATFTTLCAVVFFMKRRSL